jgi:hypothetical protein
MGKSGLSLAAAALFAVALALGAAAPGRGAPDQAEAASRLGIVVKRGGAFFFATARPDLARGAAVYFVPLSGEEPQSRRQIVEKLSREEAGRTALVTGSRGGLEVYRLAPGPNGEAETPPAAYGFGFLEPPGPASRTPGALRLPESRTWAACLFYTCTGRESLNFVVREGTRESGTTLWHASLYLGYDVESTCRDSDFR